MLSKQVITEYTNALENVIAAICEAQHKADLEEFQKRKQEIIFDTLKAIHKRMKQKQSPLYLEDLIEIEKEQKHKWGIV